MTFSVRLKLAPDPGPTGDGATAKVRGVAIALERLGPTRSQLSLTEPKPAEIVLSARLMKSALPSAAVETRAVGKLVGSIALVDDANGLEFAVDSYEPDPAVASEPEPDPSASALELPRALRLELSEQFLPAGAEPIDNLRAALPVELAEEFRHLELLAELTIGGAVEATTEQNDVLDVPLLPQPLVQVLLVDELGKPIANQKLAFAFGKETLELTTDADGRARIDNPPEDIAVVEIADLDALRKELKQRWDKPRKGPRLPSVPGTLVVLLSELPKPLAVEARTTKISVQPRVIQAEVVGISFDTSKAFLLPSPSLITALRGLTSLYDENPNSKLLLVGHCDTAGTQSYNDQLSLERAESIKSFLTDDVDGWFKFFGTGIAAEKRWGSLEESLMLGAQPDTPALFATPDPLTAFQSARGLEPSGKMDDATRKELIKGYMSQDGTSLPAGIEVVVHGCGENFPLEETGDGVDSPINRRAEMFFFDGELGVQPAPPGKNSKPKSAEYPEWRRRATDTQTFLVENRSLKLRVRMQLRGEPLAGKDFQLFIDDFLMGAGTTGDDGLIEQFVPAGAQAALIRLPDPGFERLVELTPEAAFPGVNDPKGVQLRLRHLGFYVGEIDGAGSELLDDAVLRFKVAQGLPEDSVLDAATRSALVTAYGS
jgi:outer membrane protein OmpA-like peptidoglycan-associated protein